MDRENLATPNRDDRRVRGRYRSTWLGWTDPLTGDHLTVRMKCDSEYVSELVAEGFERIVAPDAPGSSDEPATVAGKALRDEERPDACNVEGGRDHDDSETHAPRFASLAFAAEVHRTPTQRRSGNRRAG